MSALLHVYMVAGSYWLPALRAGGTRVDPRLLGPYVDNMTDAIQTKTAATLPLWPGEKPTAGDARKWLEDAEPLLSQAQRALLYDVTPASFVKYNPLTVPQPLVVSATEKA